MKARRTLTELMWLGAASSMFFFGMTSTALAFPIAVPELDPGSSASGLALLIGGALLLIERYRRRLNRWLGSTTQESEEIRK